MLKKLIAAVMALCLTAAPVSCFAEEETDYSYLEDMSVKELKALRDAINEILGDSSSIEKNDAVEGTYYGVGSYFDNNKVDYIVFTPDNSEKTMGSYKRVDQFGNVYIGDYRLSADMLTITNKYGDTVYQVTGNYLIPHMYDYSTKIPDQDLFNAIVADDDFSYEFREDGSFEFSNGFKIWKGSKYERKDDFIILYCDNGETLGVLVLNGILNNSAYISE